MDIPNIFCILSIMIQYKLKSIPYLVTTLETTFGLSGISEGDHVGDISISKGETYYAAKLDEKEIIIFDDQCCFRFTSVTRLKSLFELSDYPATVWKGVVINFNIKNKRYCQINY